MRNKLFGSREFYHRVLAISVPIMVQNAITNFVSLLDNVMIGRVGTVEMSGVAIANQLLFVSASATERTRDFCGLFPLHIAKYAANRCIYSTNLSIPFCAAPL